MDASSLTEFLEKAKSAYDAEDFEEAAQWFERASNQYAQLGDTLNAAEMANNRSVSLLRGGNAQGALQASVGTERTFAQAGDIKRQAMALGNQAAAMESLHKDQEAIRLYEQSNQLLKQMNEPALRVFVLQSLSGLHLRQHHYMNAMATMEAALEIKSVLSLRERILRKLLQIVFKMLGRS
jgi:tetratricopeptide (TPR) repeat protein